MILKNGNEKVGVHRMYCEVGETLYRINCRIEHKGQSTRFKLIANIKLLTRRNRFRWKALGSPVYTVVLEIREVEDTIEHSGCCTTVFVNTSASIPASFQELLSI